MLYKKTIRLQIKEKVQKKLSFLGILLLVFFFLFWGFALKMDISQEFRDCLKDFVKSFKWLYKFMRDHQLINNMRVLRWKIYSHMQTVCATVTTFSTIITATVIFYYSVQDSKKVGIPHRRFLIYIFGSYFLPLLFVISLINVLAIDLAWCMECKYAACYGIVMEYVIIFHIIFAILFSTSFRCSVGAICYAEHKQFNELCELGREKSWAITNARRENILHHMEQVVISNELISDKMELIERLLMIPYTNDNFVSVFCGRQCICFFASKMDTELIYYFYHENIFASLARLKNSGNKIERERLYNCIYRFLSMLTDTFWEYKYREQGELYEEIYLITVSAVMNAVQYSNVEEAEDFCVKVINEIVDKECRREAVLFYMIYQEFLYHAQAEAIRLLKIKQMDCLGENCKWEINISRCVKFWRIWSSAVAFREKNGIFYMLDAVTTLQNKLGRSAVISYINWKLGEIK